MCIRDRRDGGAVLAVEVDDGTVLLRRVVRLRVGAVERVDDGSLARQRDARALGHDASAGQRDRGRCRRRRDGVVIRRDVALHAGLCGDGPDPDLLGDGDGFGVGEILIDDGDVVLTRLGLVDLSLIHIFASYQRPASYSSIALSKVAFVSLMRRISSGVQES